MPKTKRNRPHPGPSLATPVSKRGSLKDRVGSTAAVLAVKTLTLGVVLFAYYVLAFYTAIQVVPTVFSFVRAGTGLTMDMGFDTIIAVWLAPSLFLVALLFVLLLIVMRGLWRLRSRVVLAFMGRVDADKIADGAASVGTTKLVQPRTNEKKVA